MKKSIIQIVRGFAPHKSSATVNGKRISIKKALEIVKNENQKVYLVGNFSYGQHFAYN